MKSYMSSKLRLAQIRYDKWRASSGALEEQEAVWLRLRQLLCTIYRAIKLTVLLPVSTVRFSVHLVQVLDEFERLHFSPLRRMRRGKDCVLDRQTWFVNGHNIRIGDFVKVSAFSSVMAGNVSTITIGTNTIVGPGVIIVSFNHGTRMNGVPIRYQPWQDSVEGSIVIGSDVWIGANAIILPGTSIGDGSIVGAGAIIKGAFPAKTITYCVHGQSKTVARE